MTVNDLVTPINIKIDNTVSKRFEDIEVISTLNECLTELSINTNIFIKQVDINIVKDVNKYDLPIIDIRSSGNINIVTTSEMNSLRSDWESVKGDKVTHIIYDELDTFKIFPTLEENSTLSLIGAFNHSELKLLTDTVNIKIVHKNIIIYYTAGTLLMNSGRVEDLRKGSSLLNSYGRRVKELKNFMRRDLTNDMVRYNTAFN